AKPSGRCARRRLARSRLTPYQGIDLILIDGLRLEVVIMRSGAGAEQAGVNVQTLRYYERRGLLPRTPRRDSGYREFPADAVRIVRFIKRAQDLGFTLDEVEELLRLRNDRR